MTEPQGFASGFPAAQAKANGLFEIFKEQIKVKPRHVRDHMNMLAKVNRRVAEADQQRALATGVEGAAGTVSPFCQVAFVSATEEYQNESRVYTQPGEANPTFKMPFLWNGINLSYQAEQMHRAFETRTHPTLDEDEIRRNLERRP